MTFNKHNVLIVSDDSLTLSLYQTLLSRTGYQVTIKRSGSEGLDYAIKETGNIAVVISDSNLAKTNDLHLFNKYPSNTYQILISRNVSNKELYSKVMRNETQDYIF